jgi:hypothetical protein
LSGSQENNHIFKDDETLITCRRRFAEADPEARQRRHSDVCFGLAQFDGGD